MGPVRESRTNVVPSSDFVAAIPMIKTLRLVLLLTTILAVPAISQAAMINLAVNVTQIVPGPTTYSFTFFSPVPAGSYSYASSVAELTLTPGASGEATVNVGGLYPTYLSGYGTVGAVETNLGVDLGIAPCVALRGPVTCQFPLVSNTFAPTVYDGLQALLTFEVTGAGALASWTATVTLEETPPASAPEPATALLLATGLIVAARARRWR